MASSKTSLSSESDGKGQGANLALLIIGRKYVRLEEKQMEAKLQYTPPLICISLNKNSIYCYIPRSSKHTDTCNGKAGVFCNRSQMEILRIAIVEKKDAVLPAGFGKSLVPKLLMTLFADFMDNSGFRLTETKSIVLFVSPLNALIR